MRVWVDIIEIGRTETTVISRSVIASTFAVVLLLDLLLLLLHQAKVEAIISGLGRRGLGVGGNGS